MRSLTVVVAASWLAIVAIGYGRAVRYEAGPGAPAAPPERWPADADVARKPQRCTLLVFVHPQCPCTTATIEALARLLVGRGDRVDCHVVCYDDPSFGPGFVQGPVWTAAARLPDVAMHADPGAVCARRFGVVTSGEVLCYAPAGRLVFAGGITPGRGHDGDSAGAQALAAVLDGTGSGTTRAPTFGCAIRRAPADDAPGEAPR